MNFHFSDKVNISDSITSKIYSRILVKLQYLLFKLIRLKKLITKCIK